LALSGLGSFLYQAQDVSFDINLILHKEFIWITWEIDSQYFLCLFMLKCSTKDT
jgi:hypothetical protein